MAADQLRKIYELIRVRPLLKTRPLEYVQAHVQRQMVRVRGRAGFKKVLELLDKYGSNREALEKVLMYAVMLYDYYKKKPFLDLMEIAEPIVQGVIRRRGAVYRDMRIKLRGSFAEVVVRTRGFHGNPRPIAIEIQRALKAKSEFSNLNLKVWIESR